VRPWRAVVVEIIIVAHEFVRAADVGAQQRSVGLHSLVATTGSTNDTRANNPRDSYAAQTLSVNARSFSSFSRTTSACDSTSSPLRRAGAPEERVTGTRAARRHVTRIRLAVPALGERSGRRLQRPITDSSNIPRTCRAVRHVRGKTKERRRRGGGTRGRNSSRSAILSPADVVVHAPITAGAPSSSSSSSSASASASSASSASASASYRRYPPSSRDGRERGDARQDARALDRTIDCCMASVAAPTTRLGVQAHWRDSRTKTETERSGGRRRGEGNDRVDAFTRSRSRIAYIHQKKYRTDTRETHSERGARRD